MKALVSIITVNYNGLRDTCEMIDSFRNHETYPHYEIIVVDNGSRLPEAEEIQERYRVTSYRAAPYQAALHRTTPSPFLLSKWCGTSTTDLPAATMPD